MRVRGASGAPPSMHAGIPEISKYSTDSKELIDPSLLQIAMHTREKRENS